MTLKTFPMRLHVNTDESNASLWNGRFYSVGGCLLFLGYDVPDIKRKGL